MTIFLRLLALLLFLIALLTGGCSIVFSVIAVFDPAGDAILPFVAVGFVIGIPAFFAGRALWRRTRSPAAPAPPDTPR